MHIKQILDVLGYRFSVGSNYLWNCYGENTIYLDFKTVSGKPVGSVLYDSETAEVYEVSVEVPKRPLAYRWFNPDFENDYRLEADAKGIPADIAWDDISYTDIDVEEDFLEKLQAIINEEEFDERIIVPLNLSEQEEMQLYRLAHEADMTVNDYINQLLRAEMHKLTGK
jgi:hypothetical protein